MSEKTRVFIGSVSSVLSETIRQACQDSGLDPVILQDRNNLVGEIRSAQTPLVFLQAILVEESSDNPITRIKNEPGLEETCVIVYGVRPEGAAFAIQAGADAFLPVPFRREQLDAQVRQALNLPRKVLLISNDLQSLDQFVHRLKAAGMEVMPCDSPDKAINHIKTHFPDLIITEEDLGVMKGHELCHAIRQSRTFFNLPVVILARSNDVTIVEQSFEAGAQDIVLPPYHSEDNIQRIKAIITPSKKRRSVALVVDDSGVMRNLISAMLKQLGFTVLTAVNGREGLRIACQQRPDIITSDYDMPELNGWELCSELRNDPRTKDIPVIMVTSRDSDVDKKKADVLRLNGYLTKPFTSQELQAMVKHVLTSAQKEREQKTISKYIAADTLQNVKAHLEAGREIEPEEKFISILFSDICAFSGKCERYDPKKIVELLNIYFDCMVKVLLDNHAIIDKFIGDAIVARFDSGDRVFDALSAVKAAYGMLSTLKELNTKIFEPIEIRIGINSGEAILGNLGCLLHRLDYTMIGDNVNIAERLEAGAQPQSCILSEATYLLVSDYVNVGDKMTLKVKGRTNEVNAYPLLSLKEPSSDMLP